MENLNPNNIKILCYNVKCSNCDKETGKCNIEDVMYIIKNCKDIWKGE